MIGLEMIMVLIIVIILLLIIKKKFRNKKDKQKEKQWVVFERIEGEANNPQRCLWALNKKTGAKTECFKDKNKLLNYIRILKNERS